MATLTAPKKTGAPGAPAKKAVAALPTGAAGQQAAAARLKTREEGLIGLAQIGAFLCTIRGQFANVGTINAYATETCHELAAVGEENELIGRGLDMLAAAGPYTKLLTVALPFALQLAANSGRMDWKLAQNLGVVDPEIMAAKAKADILAMAQEAAAQQAAAQREAAEHAQAMDRVRERNGDQQQQPVYG